MNPTDQAELSGPVRDLDFPNQKAQLLAYRLQVWNLLLPGVNVTEYRIRENNLIHFFEKREHVVACIDVNGLGNFMNISYDPKQEVVYRLFSSLV